MRSLDAARAVCERFHPGLIKELKEIPYAERERPGSPVIDLFRIHGGVGLLIPGEYGGHGASPLEALRVQLALGAESPSLVAAVSMHHFTAAMLYSLAGNAGRLTGAQTDLLHRIVPEQQVMASGWAEGRTAQNILTPGVTARPVQDGYLLSGAKKPCSLSHSMSLLTASIAIHDGDVPELALALVPAGAPGLSVHPFWGNDLLAGAESDEVRLDNVFVPADMVVRAGADDPQRLDDLQTAGFVWFEMLIAAGYAGGAAALVEQVLDRERGSVRERASLAVDVEASLALLEGVARGIGTEPGDEESVARVLVARYAVQNALPSIAARALELLGGLDFIRDSANARTAAAVRALAFHPPGQGAAAEPLLGYFGGGPLVLA
ncbi:acyl-CoA dehydrogenase family protein [Streptomyces lacrimifluminis]|uniref:Oxidoreductase n=1 Tax=Streptomyces lacrimifluminis TaxID=1500077 RepID=A0A917NXC3_9ACTN|nr:acyl-CoA dehydrogenase family protein [Streptomyces lacrimifluminis]GGJ38329.1 oxidoreductase [Streptomyces lacrimifluminis]